MRISDWSSDVCSSDLFLRQGRAKQAEAGDLGDQFGREASLVEAVADDRQHALVGEPGHGALDGALLFAEQGADVVQVVGVQGPGGFFGSVKAARSEERSVGKEWFSTFRSRWSPY